MSSLASSTKPIHLFYSYSHKDEQLRDELEKHLMGLKRQGIITDWYDRDIRAGDEWKRQINSHLNTADIILLLVSADFLASDYCYSIELASALQRQEHGSARVIPIILRPVDWSVAPFGQLQALPTNAKPITLWANRDEAFENVAKGIRAVVEQPHRRRCQRWRATPTEPEHPSKPSNGISPLRLWKILLVPPIAWFIGHAISLIATRVSTSPFVIVGTIGGMICIILATWLIVSLTNTTRIIQLGKLIRLAVYFVLAGLVSGFVGLSLWLFGCNDDMGSTIQQVIGCHDTTNLAWRLVVGLSSLLALAGACLVLLIELGSTRARGLCVALQQHLVKLTR